MVTLYVLCDIAEAAGYMCYFQPDGSLLIVDAFLVALVPPLSEERPEGSSVGNLDQAVPGLDAPQERL